MEEIGTKTYTEFKAKNGHIIKRFYLPKVTAKADVKGYKVKIRADANPQLIEFYKLLKDAVFSAKNYSSKALSGEDISNTDIHLGKSNLYRAVVSSISNLGYDNSTSASAFYAGYIRAKKYNNDSVKKHLFHLKFIYELTGGGVTYNGIKLNEVNYLVYNDPASDKNVYVKSSAEIISDVLNNHIIFNGDILSSVRINKTYFYH